MPIYEYRCESCDSVSEKLVRNGQEPTACPECGEEALKRLISRAGIIFKGSGFYVTDSKSSSGSKSGSKAEAGKGETSSSGDSSAKSEPKSGSSEKSSTTTSSGD
ncbi:MAG: zinc ribbon domain-containing protein [Vulcanimicrobiota bacterium]